MLRRNSSSRPGRQARPRSPRVPVARRRVEQAPAAGRGRPGGGASSSALEGIGEQVLDRLEAVGGGGGEAVEKVVLRCTSSTGWRRIAAWEISGGWSTSARRSGGAVRRSAIFAQRLRPGWQQPQAGGFFEFLERGHGGGRRLVPDVGAQPVEHHRADRHAAVARGSDRARPPPRPPPGRPGGGRGSAAHGRPSSRSRA